MAPVDPFSNSAIALPILFERLNWPVPMVRWRAARELRSLAESDVTRTATIDALLAFLERCHSESEVCTVLNLVFLISPSSRPSRAGLASRIRKPSILSDYLLNRSYGASIPDWMSAHSGAVPFDFEVDSYFEKHKTAHMAPVFSDRLKRLEKETGLPFERHWAYEWRRVRDELQTRYTLYPHYFDNFGETRSGIVGNYLQRQSEVFRSAFLRTFAYAVQEWNMPPYEALHEVIDLLPVIGGLFDLTPHRPEWLGSFPDACLEGDLEPLVRGQVSKLDGQRRVVSLTSPFSAGVERYGDVYVGAFLVSEDFIPPERVITKSLDFIDAVASLDINGAYQTAEINEVRRPGRTGWYVPVCTSLFPIPFGLWNGDYLAIGMPVVASYCLPNDARLSVAGGNIEQGATMSKYASTTLWNDAWVPRHPLDGTTRCGAMASLSADIFEALPAAFGLRLAWFVKTRIWSRKSDFGDYDFAERQAFVLQ